MDFVKVVNLICKDENYYFKSGIAEIIREALLTDVNVNFLTECDSESLQVADFILMNSSQWRLFMCQPAYRYRKSGSVLLVFMDDVNAISPASLPVCYQSLTAIDRFESVRHVRDKITRAWLAANEEEAKVFSPSDCSACHINKISLVQLQIVSFLKKGKTIRQIASILGLSVKTIYAHKYNIMRKFDLKGEHEFYLFLNDLSLSQLYKGVIE
ncbi:helix-turn-helix transcriptional regulator [Pantoea sp. KPR_PJ]|uniref:helix-turn-helix transcriptional regulator n=1 Tax=Pantoea sp. KPR_PJ TaxID=2738375 RepID=UPI003528ACC2